MGLILLSSIVLSVLLGSTPVSGGSLNDIEHVVIFMQENRSWNSVSARSWYSRWRLYSWDQSISVQWLESEALMIPMFKLTPTAIRFGTSKHCITAIP